MFGFFVNTENTENGVEVSTSVSIDTWQVELKVTPRGGTKCPALSKEGLPAEMLQTAMVTFLFLSASSQVADIS